MTREETTSLTVALESLLMIAVIAAKERRKKGWLICLVLTSAPPWKRRTRWWWHCKARCQITLQGIPGLRDPGEWQVKILNARLKKVLYRLLKSALYFCLKLWGHLASKGFKINPYNLCLANKEIDGHQRIICWHLDNLIICTRQQRSSENSRTSSRVSSANYRSKSGMN